MSGGFTSKRWLQTGELVKELEDHGIPVNDAAALNRWKSHCPALGGKSMRTKPHPRHANYSLWFGPQVARVVKKIAAAVTVDSLEATEFVEGGKKWVWVKDLESRYGSIPEDFKHLDRDDMEAKSSQPMTVRVLTPIGPSKSLEAPIIIRK